MAVLRTYAWLTRPWVWLVLAVLATGSAGALAAPSEYQVKAVFLFNFAQFVDWPAEAFTSPDAPFVIGILGQDPFGSQLDDVVRGETVNNRTLVVERYRSVAEIRDCNILFIGGNESGHLDEILMALKGRSSFELMVRLPAFAAATLIRRRILLFSLTS